MMTRIKDILRPWIPMRILSEYRGYIDRKSARQLNKVFSGKDPKFIFTKIYKEKWWGIDKDGGFFSGSGSHDPFFVAPYVESVKTFFREFSEKPSVVDLGCGDFNIGSQLVDAASQYTACDIVDELIENHKKKYSGLNIHFLSLDITTDSLPPGTVGIIKEALQHLSNEQIFSVLPKLKAYQFLIVSEYHPLGKFQPNIDQPCGAHSRTARGIKSGVVLTEAPFFLKVLDERILSEVESDSGILRTLVYKMQ